MEEEIFDEIVKGVLLIDNKKINAAESLDKYIRNFNVKQLTMSASVYIWETRNYSEMFKIKNMANKKKDHAANYVLERLEEIVKTYIEILPSDILKQLEKASKYEEIISYKIYENYYTIQFIDFLKRSILGRVYFDKKDDTIMIYIPNEIKDIIKKSLNDKNVIKKNKKYNKIYDFTLNCTATYGILTIYELYSLFSKFKFKITIDELNNILNSYGFVDSEFNIFSFDNNVLITNLEFSNLDEAFDIFENCNENLNDKLSLETIKEIGEDKYIYKLKSYNKLINWLAKRYEGIKKDHDIFDKLIVIDYIYSAQISIDIANNNFKRNIDRFLDIDIFDKNILAKMLEDIFLEYPKWSKRGNF